MTEESLKISYAWAIQHYLGTFEVEELSREKQDNAVLKKFQEDVVKSVGHRTAGSEMSMICFLC